MCSFCWNFTERQLLWSLCSVDFHTLALQLPIQTPHSVAPELQVFVSSLKFSVKRAHPCCTFTKTKGHNRKVVYFYSIFYEFRNRYWSEEKTLRLKKKNCMEIHMVKHIFKIRILTGTFTFAIWSTFDWTETCEVLGCVPVFRNLCSRNSSHLINRTSVIERESVCSPLINVHLVKLISFVFSPSKWLKNGKNISEIFFIGFIRPSWPTICGFYGFELA